MADVADDLWQWEKAELIDRVRELEGDAERTALDTPEPITGELVTLHAEAGHPAASALDDAAIAIASRIVNGAADLDPSDVSSLGYAAWCVAAAADNRQPHRGKSNPSE